MSVDWADIVARVDFRFPLRIGVAYEPARDPDPLGRLVFVLNAPDVNTGMPTKIYRAVESREMPDVASAVKYLRRYALDMLSHELDEWLTFDGRRVTDPHAGDRARRAA